MTRIQAIDLYLVGLPLVRPFRTSFGEAVEKQCILARVRSDAAEGWGECVADIDPGFSEEFNQGAWIVLKEFLGPALLGAGEISAADIEARFASVRGNPMAKATLINAVIDAELKAEGLSLSRWLGGDKDRVPCGVSVGITPTTQDLIEQVDGYLAEGYRRIKLKIEPRTDVERVEAVRGAHPGVALSVDANAAYSLDAIDVFTALDRSRLLMIEQPLHYSDLLEHAKLQRAITTDLCLDESIRSAADARAAIELGSCRIVNIKQGRVGGVLEAVRVHDTCREAGVPVWCGGMLETGVGRATNLGLASLPNFTLPGDTSASSRYFHEDLTEPFEMSSDGMMEVPKGPGIGVEPLTEVLVERTIRRETLRR